MGWEEEVWNGRYQSRADRARILVADNVELFRRGLREALAGGGRFVVAAEAARVEDVPSIYARVRPDVTVLAVSDDEAGRRALQDLQQIDQRVRVIVLIAPEASEQALQFIQAGAQAVLLRDAPTATILAALSDVSEGGCALDARLANLLFRRLAGSPVADRVSPADGLNPRVLSLLSRREREVLEALARGLPEQADRRGAGRQRRHRKDALAPYLPQVAGDRQNGGGAEGAGCGSAPGRLG